jgi:hypothetical protein
MTKMNNYCHQVKCVWFFGSENHSALYPNGMDPSLFSLGSEELKMMFGAAALNLNRRVMHAGDDDGD